MSGLQLTAEFYRILPVKVSIIIDAIPACLLGIVVILIVTLERLWIDCIEQAIKFMAAKVLKLLEVFKESEKMLPLWNQDSDLLNVPV